MANQEVKIEISAIDKTRAVFESLKKSFAGLTAESLGMTLSIGGAFTALANTVRTTANAGEEMLKLTQQMGIATEKIGGLKYAAELSETEFDAVAKGVKKLSGGMAEGSDAFTLLGVKTKDNNGNLRNTYDVLLDVADKFSVMKDGAGKTALAVDMFGKSGQQMIPLLNQGADGLRNMQQEAERLGITFSRESAEAADKFNDNLTTLKKTVTGFSYAIGNDLIPKLTHLLNLFSIQGLNEIEKNTILKRKGALEGMLKNAYDSDEITRIKTELANTDKELLDLFGTTFSEKPKPKQTQNSPALINKAGESADKALKAFLGEASLAGMDEYDKEIEKITQKYNGLLEVLNKAHAPTAKAAEAFEKLKAAVFTDEEKAGKEAVAEAIKKWVQDANDTEKLLAEGVKEGISEWVRETNELEAAQKKLAEAMIETQRRNIELNLSLLDGFASGVQKMQAEIKTTFQHGEDIAKSTAQGMSSAFETFFFDVMRGKVQGLGGYIQMFLGSIQQALAKAMAGKLIGAGISAFNWNAAGGDAYAAEGAAWDLAYADGGVANGGWRSVIKAYANGSIVDRPTIGIVGEGRYNEAIVPLPDGRSIPVSMTGGKGGGNTIIVINAMDTQSIHDALRRSGAVTSITTEDAARNGDGIAALRKYL